MGAQKVDGESAGKWLFIGLTVGAVLMAMLYNLPPILADPPPVNCDESCLARLDIPAQQSMARAAWAMFIVTALSVGVGAASLWLIWKNLVATREIVEETRAATRTAEHSTEATLSMSKSQTRAYLEVVSIGYEFVGTPRYPQITIEVANGGQSPARKVRVSINMVVQKLDNGWRPIASSFTRKWLAPIPGGRAATVQLMPVPNPVRNAADEIDDDDTVRFVVEGELAFTDIFFDRWSEVFQFRSDTTFQGVLVHVVEGDRTMSRLPEPGRTEADDGSV